MSSPRRCGVVLVLTTIIVNLQLCDLLPGGMIAGAASVPSARHRQAQQHVSRDQPPVSRFQTCYADVLRSILRVTHALNIGRRIVLR